MKVSAAWLLNIGSGRLMGVGERELLHLVELPELAKLPQAPRHCMRLLTWQGLLLPVWDIPAWLERDAVTDHVPLVGIVGYQSRPREMPRFGAIILTEPPVRIWVSDAQGCPLPEHPGLDAIAISCFVHEEKAVPILDLPRMFFRYLPSRE